LGLHRVFSGSARRRLSCHDAPDLVPEALRSPVSAATAFRRIAVRSRRSIRAHVWTTAPKYAW